MIATVEGRIGFIKTLKKGGISISIAEPKNNEMQKPKWNRVVAWGKKAKAIKEKIKVGQNFKCSCTVSITSKDEKQSVNLTVNTWTQIHKPKYTFDSQVKKQRDDDWFVPDTRANTQTQHQRRYEGFQD